MINCRQYAVKIAKINYNRRDISHITKLPIGLIVTLITDNYCIWGRQTNQIKTTGSYMYPACTYTYMYVYITRQFRPPVSHYDVVSVQPSILTLSYIDKWASTVSRWVQDGSPFGAH